MNLNGFNYIGIEHSYTIQKPWGHLNVDIPPCYNVWLKCDTYPSPRSTPLEHRIASRAFEPLCQVGCRPEPCPQDPSNYGGESRRWSRQTGPSQTPSSRLLRPVSTWRRRRTSTPVFCYPSNLKDSQYTLMTLPVYSHWPGVLGGSQVPPGAIGALRRLCARG